MTDTGPRTSPQPSIAVAMFSVADQDAAIAFYRRLGWEVRTDLSFGEHGENRWVEVAPPGSTARLALNPPMTGQPGGGAVGLDVADVQAEHARLSALDGVDVDAQVVQMPGTPAMFSLRDPDGNALWVVGRP